MANPARELVDILRSAQFWEGGGVYATRGGSDPGDIDFWRRQSRAIRLLTEVDEVLLAREQAGRSVEHYRGALVAAYRGIFAPNVPWNGAGKAELTPGWAIDQIAGLADNLDDAGFAGVVVPEQAKRDIGTVLDELAALMASGDLPIQGPSSAYVQRLILSIRNLVEDADNYGDVDLLRHIYELIGVLLTFANTAETQEQPAGPIAKLRELAARLVPFVEPTGFALGLLADTDAVVKMIAGS